MQIKGKIALITGGSGDLGGAIARRLGQVGQAEDIAGQVITFVSSTSITGQSMVIDGGMPGSMR